MVAFFKETIFPPAPRDTVGCGPLGAAGAGVDARLPGIPTNDLVCLGATVGVGLVAGLGGVFRVKLALTLLCLSETSVPPCPVAAIRSINSPACL